MSWKFYPPILAFLLVLASAKAKEAEQTTERWSDDDLFYYGMAAGTFVSLIGFFAAFLLLSLRKIMPETMFTVIIQILFAFSCGALLGETMLHVLPEAYASKQLKDQYVSLIFIAAIMAFVLLERVMEKVGIAHEHWHEDQQESHHVKEKRQLQQQKNQGKVSEAKEPTGFLNLIGSLLHNFIDGLAIGVAFSLGNPNEFLPVTIGIIVHQIPRQMGDVAILLKSHFNERETVLSNGIVNLISLVGVYLGLNSHNLSFKTRQYVLVFVAGNFMYIASDIWKNLFRHRKWMINLLEAAGLLTGVYLAMGHNHSH